jgi:hypothetical protein
MVNKAEILVALKGPTVGETEDKELEKFLIDILANYIFDSGFPMEMSDRMMFAARWLKSIKHPFQLLHLNEVELAMRWAGQGHLGVTDWPSIQLFNKYIRLYMELLERKTAIAENMQRLLPPKPAMTEEQLREMMVWAWKGVEKAEREKTLYADTGNVLFDYMNQRGKITLEKCDIEEAVEYHTLLSLNAGTDIGGIQADLSKDAVRLHSQGDSRYIMPMAKKFALRRLNRELIMEREAEEIRLKQETLLNQQTQQSQI